MVHRGLESTDRWRASVGCVKLQHFFRYPQMAKIPQKLHFSLGGRALDEYFMYLALTPRHDMYGVPKARNHHLPRLATPYGPKCLVSCH